MAITKGQHLTITNQGVVVHKSKPKDPSDGISIDLDTGTQTTFVAGAEVWKQNAETYAAMAAATVGNLDHTQFDFIKNAVSSSDYGAMFNNTKMREGNIGTQKSFTSLGSGFQDETLFGAGGEVGIDMNTSLIIGMRGIEIGTSGSRGGRNYLRMYNTGSVLGGALAGSTPTQCIDIFTDGENLFWRTSDGTVRMAAISTHGHGGGG